jgi:hypothetical protein
MANPFLWLMQPLFAPLPDSYEQNAQLVLVRWLTWRRSLLVLVLLFALLTAALDTATKLSGPTPPFTILFKLELGSGPVQQTLFGDLADLVWLLSFYAMPASALLATVFWTRPRSSGRIVLAGWMASFLLQVAIALTPWSWWELAPPASATGEALLARQYERVAAGLAWGYYYVVVLSPAVLALVPGIIRACIRVKMLLPQAVLPGWFLIAATPFNGLLVLVSFVALAQVAPSALLLAGMLLWLAAPFVYLSRARVYTRPLVSREELRSLSRVQGLAWLLALCSAACLIAYAFTGEIFGMRLVGLEPKSSLYRPWQLIRYCLDFSGRTLFITVMGADLLLRASLSAWRHQRSFMATPAAEEYDRLLGELEETIAGRSSGWRLEKQFHGSDMKKPAWRT